VTGVEVCWVAPQLAQKASRSPTFWPQLQQKGIISFASRN